MSSDNVFFSFWLLFLLVSLLREDDLVFKTVLVVLLMSSDRMLKVFLPTFSSEKVGCGIMDLKELMENKHE